MFRLWWWCAGAEISSISQISAHRTTPSPPCPDSNLGVYLKMKSPHFSPDLISSPEIISNVLTLLSKYVNIIANYFLAPCTFYFRLREKFVFLESLCSRQYSCSRSDPSCSIVWELAITLHYITLPLHNNVMLPHHPLCLSQPAVCSYKVYCSAPQPTSRVLTDNLIR